MKPKVFCIGFHKTGTTSMKLALEQLGYRVTGPNGARDPDIEAKVVSMAYDLVEKFDAFQDNPWPILYKELDVKFPGSKFVLTLRSSESWIKSQLKNFGNRETPMRKWIYGVGCPEGNEDVYIKRFLRHYEEVREYFKGREDDILEIDLSQGDGWEKLCPFLGVDVPDSPFPHANKASDRGRKNRRKFVNRIGNFFKRLRK